MKTKILFLAFLALFFSNSNAETWSMNYCKNVSAQVNSLPMNVDLTDLINTFCLPIIDQSLIISTQLTIVLNLYQMHKGIRL